MSSGDLTTQEDTMQWSDVTTPPPQKMLRQFAGLWLVVFGGLAAWRAWHGDRPTPGPLASALAGLVVGARRPGPADGRSAGSITGWMIVAFPIGWTVSRLVLARDVLLRLHAGRAVVFRLIGRDALHLRRRRRGVVLDAQAGAGRAATTYFPAVLSTEKHDVELRRRGAEQTSEPGFVAEFWLLPDTARSGGCCRSSSCCCVRRPGVPVGHGRGAVHLHAVLRPRPEASKIETFRNIRPKQRVPSTHGCEGGFERGWLKTSVIPN